MTIHLSRVRRLYSGVVLALAASLMLAGSAPAHSETKLTLALSGLSEGKLPIYVAQNKGYLKDAGIDIEIFEFRSGGEAVKAFLGGGTDFCICAADHVLILKNRGLDVKLLFGLDAHYPNALVTKADSPLTDVHSLKGKKIGITSPGSSTDNILRWTLAQAGLDPATDVDIISVGTGPAMRVAIATGAVDAGILGNAEIIDANRRGDKPKIVVDWRSTEVAALNVIGRDKWIKANPAVAKAFVQALTKGALELQNNPESAVAGVKAIFPEKDDGFIRELAESARRHLSKDGTISEKGYQNTQDILLRADASLKPVKLSDVNAQPELVQ